MLTLKTVALVALATAPRAQTLLAMNLDNMLVERKAVVFLISDVLKTSRVGNFFSLRIEHFDDEALCAMHTLLHYIQITKKVRLSRYIFVSFVTFRWITSSTIARWLKLVLELSGKDSGIFKAHSFRGATASVAYNRGCALQTILKTANWKTDKNFKKFYSRHLLQKKRYFLLCCSVFLSVRVLTVF